VEAHNARLTPMHLKEVETPNGLTARDISSIQVLLDLIGAGAKLHSGAVMALVHILVDVLDRFDRGDGLDINVAAVLPDEIPRVADNPAIVNSFATDCICDASVRASGAGVGVLRNRGGFPKGLGKAFGTGAIDDARSVTVVVVCTTGSVNHELLNEGKELIIKEGEL
jgi:hypothetical protein